MLTTFVLPEFVEETAEVLRDHGHRVWLVGGALRDILTNRVPHDWDLATDALPEEVRLMFAHVVPTGERFGSVTVLWPRPGGSFEAVEVTTLRRESDYALRHPGTVEFHGDILEDLGRRDFSVNAMAIELTAERAHVPLCHWWVLDPFGGMVDLADHTIRAIGDPATRFEEDPLRMLRAVRFCVSLSFSLESYTEAVIQRLAYMIDSVSKERIRQELENCLMSDSPHRAIALMHHLGLLGRILPEVAACVNVTQDSRYHAGDVFTHTICALKYACRDLEVRLAVLLHDVGKPRCKSVEQGRIHFYGHDEQSARIADRVLRDLRFSNDTVERVVSLVREHMLDVKMGKPGVRRLLLRLGNKELLWKLLSVRYADLMGARVQCDERLDGLFHVQDVVAEVLNEMASPRFELAIDGYDIMRTLGIVPGPEVGRVKRELMDWMLEDPASRNDRGVLLNQLAMRMASANTAQVGGGCT